LALAGAGASNPRGRRHHNSHAEAVQKRAAEEYRAAGLAARSGSTAPAVARKRANSRCGPRNSTTTTTTSITSTVTDPIGNPGGDPTTSPTTTSTAHKNLETTTSVAPPATTTTSGGGGAGGATYSGDGKFTAHRVERSLHRLTFHSTQELTTPPVLVHAV
jgi:type II secretory pathway pseudopilin PulG